MNTFEDLYGVWAGAHSPWSVWAKPVLFAQTAANAESDPSRAAPPEQGVSAGDEAVAAWMPDARRDRLAIVVNLPAAEALHMGVLMARRGYQPVPLFNGCAGGPRPAVEMGLLLARLPEATAALRAIALAPDAPPAFLLDANRCPQAAPGPGGYDNRWVVFPQDFPSARFLLRHDIRAALLVGQNHGCDDLNHVLRRWQEDGIALQRVGPDMGRVETLEVPRPPMFRSLLYRLQVLAGLRRNSIGGFGALVAMPSSSGGFG